MHWIVLIIFVIALGFPFLAAASLLSPLTRRMVDGLNTCSFNGISDKNGVFCLGLMEDDAPVVVATVSCV